MEKNTVIYIVSSLVVGIILGAIFFSQTQIISNTDNSQLEECQSQLNQCEKPEQYKPIQTDTITLSFDFMGAVGDEPSGFGDGWIDSSECLEQINKIDTSTEFKSCRIENVQLLFGSDPNPFKSKNAGYSSSRVGDNIFGNGEVFRVKCFCSSEDEF